jgi:hypothetical protein
MRARTGGLGAVVISILIAAGIMVSDVRDGQDYPLRDPSTPVWLGIHSTETYGKGVQYIKDLHRDQGWPDAGYVSLTTWQGVVTIVSDPEEMTWGVSGRNSQIMSHAYLGSGQSKAWTYRGLTSMIVNVNANAEAVAGQGGVILGVAAHRDLALPGRGTDCPGEVAYNQAIVDGFFSHVKINGELVQNPYFKDGVMKGTFIYAYLYEKGLVK